MLAQADGVALLEEHHLAAGVGDDEDGAAVIAETHALHQVVADGAVVEAVDDAVGQLAEALQHELVVVLLAAEDEDHRQVAGFEVALERRDVLHGVGGWLAARVQEAEDEIVVLDELLRLLLNLIKIAQYLYFLIFFSQLSDKDLFCYLPRRE